eukprot:gene20833-27664_t
MGSDPIDLAVGLGEHMPPERRSTPASTCATTSSPAATCGTAPAATSGAVAASTSGTAPAATSGTTPAASSGAAPAPTSGAAAASTSGTALATTTAATAAVLPPHLTKNQLKTQSARAARAAHNYEHCSSRLRLNSLGALISPEKKKTRPEESKSAKDLGCQPQCGVEDDDDDDMAISMNDGDYDEEMAISMDNGNDADMELQSRSMRSSLASRVELSPANADEGLGLAGVDQRQVLGTSILQDLPPMTATNLQQAFTNGMLSHFGQDEAQFWAMFQPATALGTPYALEFYCRDKEHLPAMHLTVYLPTNTLHPLTMAWGASVSPCWLGDEDGNINSVHDLNVFLHTVRNARCCTGLPASDHAQAMAAIKRAGCKAVQSVSEIQYRQSVHFFQSTGCEVLIDPMTRTHGHCCTSCKRLANAIRAWSSRQNKRPDTSNADPGKISVEVLEDAVPSPHPSVVLPLLPARLPQPNPGVVPLPCRGEECEGKGLVPRDARGPKGCMHCRKCCKASQEAAQGPYSCAAHKGSNKKT